MTLKSLHVESYRSFNEPSSLELRPLTLVIGKNNAGKSSILRALSLLESGIRPTTTLPLEPSLNNRDLAVPFTDLLPGHSPHGSLKLGFRLSVSQEVEYSVSAEVQHFNELNAQIVTSFSLSGPVEWRCEWDPGLLNLATPIYRVKHHDSWRPGQMVQFRGILPCGEASKSAVPKEVAQAIEQIRAKFPTVRHLAPLRATPRSYGRIKPVLGEGGVGLYGEHSSDILALNHIRHNGELLERVNDAMSPILGDWRLSIQSIEDFYKIGIVNGEGTMQVPLDQAGAGLAQALPIFVHILAGDPEDPPAILAVEQPEIHLHPAVHGAVGQFLFETSSPANVIVAESHSESLILRIRRLIAQKRDSSGAALYSITQHGGEACAAKVEIDSLGNVSNWPQGVFEEALAEVRDLVDAQQLGIN